MLEDDDMDSDDDDEYVGPYDLNRQEAFEFGAHTIIIFKMKKHMNRNDIQLVCICCLTEMSKHTSIDTGSTIRIIKAGGIEATVNALNLHRDIEPLAVPAASLLECLLYIPAEKEGNQHFVEFIERACTRLVEQHNIVSLIDYELSRNQDDECLLLPYCHILHSLTNRPNVLTKK